MKHVVSAAPSRQRVLVTGFGAFPGARTNPTLAILARLERERDRLARLGIALRCVRLPVVYAEIEAALRDAAVTFRPDAVLHLGLAGRRSRLCVETRAINHAGPLHPDAARRLPAGWTLAADGPAALATTYSAARILTAIRRTGLAACASIDAGDYVCNATLYHALNAPLAPHIGFLHIPRTRRAIPTARAKSARPTIEALTRATLAAIMVLGSTSRQTGRSLDRP